jgi:hypothetical protein
MPPAWRPQVTHEHTQSHALDCPCDCCEQGCPHEILTDLDVLTQGLIAWAQKAIKP